MAIFLARPPSSSSAVPKRYYLLLSTSVSSLDHLGIGLNPPAFAQPPTQKTFNSRTALLAAGVVAADHAAVNFVKFLRHGLLDYYVGGLRLAHTVAEAGVEEEEACEQDDVWRRLQDEARSATEQEPILSNYYHTSILRHPSLEAALANYLSIKLADLSLPAATLNDLFANVLVENKDIVRAVEADLRAVKERDPACGSYSHCFLNFKGFLACQAHRIAHKLWSQDRKSLALLIQSRVSEVFAMDIHPGARIGQGILFDHATGVVVGETAVIGNDVAMLHNVTLGGTGKMSGDRHPKIGDGVLIGAGASILGNIRIGEGAKIGAGSVVLKEVQPWTTVVGNPARVVGGKENPVKLDKKPSLTMDHTSNMADWYDYCV